MHTVSYEFLMQSEESAGYHQTVFFSWVGSGHETTLDFGQLPKLTVTELPLDTVFTPLPVVFLSQVVLCHHIPELVCKSRVLEGRKERGERGERRRQR